MGGFRSPVAPWLRRSQVGLMISDREGMPNVVLEYMAAALPIVVTDLPGIREMVTHSETGLIVPADGVGEVVDALRSLRRDPARARNMGLAGRRVLDGGRFSEAHEHRVRIGMLQRAAASASETP